MGCHAIGRNGTGHRGVHSVDRGEIPAWRVFFCLGAGQKAGDTWVVFEIRNPIYVFGSLVIAEMILVIGKAMWLLIFVVIIPLQIQRARKGQAVLEAAFGEEYRKYRAGTWF